MNDASSHLATAVLFKGWLGGEPWVLAHYDFDLILVPYWSITLLLQPLLAVFSPALALQLLVAAYAVLLPFVHLRLLDVLAPESRALAAVGALALFNWAYYLGELPFLLGQPLVVGATALFWGLKEVRSLRLAGFVAVSLLIYASHLFALVGLVVAVGVSLPLAALKIRAISRAQWLALGWSAALFLLAAYFTLFHHGTEANQGRLVFDWSAWRLLNVVVLPLGEPGHALTGALMGAGLLSLLGLAAYQARHVLRRAVVLELALPAVSFAGLAWLGPAGVMEPLGFEDIGQRFTLLAVLFGVGAVRLPSGVTLERWVLALLLFAGGVKLAQAQDAHHRHLTRALAVSALLDRLPEGAKLLPLFDVPSPTQEDYWLHRFGNFAVVTRHAYGPHVFARTGQQPLRHRHQPDYRPVADLTVDPEEWAFYDYVLIQSASSPRLQGLLSHAALVAQAGAFSLYRIAPAHKPSL